MPTYDRANADARNLVAERIASGHYPDLVESEATVSAWFAYAKADEPAVKVNGQPSGATIKPNSAKDRLEGKADASLTIDGEAWKTWDDGRRAAEIDHQLERLAVSRSKVSKSSPVAYILTDDAGRPKLKLRKHDYQIGYFVAIADRHGAAAPEVRAVREFLAEVGPQVLGDDEAEPAPMPRLSVG